MPWNTLQPVLPELLRLHARIARLQLLHKLQATELHLHAAGVDTAALGEARRALLAQPLAADGSILKAPTTPPVQADGTQRLRHLLVSEPRRV